MAANDQGLECVDTLQDMFGNAFQLEVIKEVATSCGYDVEKSSNKLLELSSSYAFQAAQKSETNPNKSKLSQPYEQTNNTNMKNSFSTGTIPKASKNTISIQKTINLINKEYKVLVILRGVPGSGKSCLAKMLIDKTLANSNYSSHILSTDDFFTKSGHYIFEPMKVPEAHGWNHNRAFKILGKGVSPVIIDNTNICAWEMKPYLQMGVDYGYYIEILEPDTPWAFNEYQLSIKNTHDIPRQKIKDMLERYEKNITSQKLLSAYNINYGKNRPPQYRSYPPLSAGSRYNNNNDLNQIARNHESSIVKSLSANVLYHDYESSLNGETINLMDFNGDSLPEPKIKSDTQYTIDENLFDKISMRSHSNSNVLQPIKNEVILIDSDEETVSSSVSTLHNKNKLDHNVENTWGIDEKAMRSWKIVLPVNHTPNQNRTSNKSLFDQKETKTTDVSCNTNDDKDRIVKILDTKSRDINTCFTPVPKPKRGMIDRSCLTEEVDDDENIHVLLSMFPHVKKHILLYFYNQSNQNMDFTIDMLLQGNNAFDDIVDDDEIRRINIKPEIMDIEEANSNNCSKESKMFKRKLVTEKSMELKKELEDKFDISDNFYSNNLLRVKQIKYGNIYKVNDDNQPSNSKEPNYALDNATKNMETISIDDSNFDSEEEYDSDEKLSSAEPNETVELNLGEVLVAQLENQVGDPNIMYPKGFQPLVQVPKDFARQLYAFYIESVFQQMDAQNEVLQELIKEDEEFARKLQKKDNQVQETPSLKQIMTDQANAAFVHEMELDRNITPDNLALKLTKQKLFATFPTVEPNILLEIFNAHGSKYKDTIETLLMSTGPENVSRLQDKIKEPPIDETIISEMREDHQKNINDKPTGQGHPATQYREQAFNHLKQRDILYKKAQMYYQRGMTEVAIFYSNLATQQTNYYDSANSLAAASFVEEHFNKLQDFNTIDLHYLFVKEAIQALDLFIDKNINLLQGGDTKSAENLFVITGRGRNSRNGRAKIKPAVIRRLNRRNIS